MHESSNMYLNLSAIVCHVKLSLLTSEQGRKVKVGSHIIRIVFVLVN